MGNQTTAKLNRKGNSHAGKTIYVYSAGFFGRDKLTPTERDVFNALYSFAQNQKAAEFSFSDLAARYNISYSSVSRAMKKVFDFFRKEGAFTYKIRDDVLKGLSMPKYMYVPDWLHHAVFSMSDGSERDLTENQINVLAYILHQNGHVKHWNRTQAGIARDLEIAPSTVSDAIALFEELGLLTVTCSGAARRRAANHYERTFYNIDFDRLNEVKSQTIHNLKALPHAVRDADARTDREQFYANRQRIANRHANTVKKELGPDYAALERDLRELELQILKEQKKRNTETVRTILDRRLAIQGKIRELLASFGYTEEDLKPRFICKECQDTGWRKDKTPCNCYIPPSGGDRR